MKRFDRRSFLKSSALAAGALGFSPALLRAQSNVNAQVAGANDDIRIAVIGLRQRGKNHIENYRTAKGVRIVALCDVDQEILDEQAAKVKEFSPNVQTFRDVRKLLEAPGIDAVSIATPNHWHALGAIWAVQAGKDVYVEKPVSHNIWEGRKIVEAARKYNRIVQAGTQTRSSPAVKEAIEWLRAGNLGKPVLGRVLCYNRRESIGKADGPLVIPDTIDYDLWCGPAPKETLHRKRLHYDWHWVWPTGNGDIGNQGVHQVDMVRWALGYDELSPRVFSLGGRFGYEDDATTPNTQIVWHDYKTTPVIVEMRGLPTKDGSNSMDQYRGKHRGVSGVVECEGGYFVIPNYTSAVACDKDGNEIKKWEGTTNHYHNFIKAVRSHKVGDLNCDILEGHLSAALCHTGNISQQLGRKVSADELAAAIKNEKEVADAVGRMEEHLSANLVNMKQTQFTLGPVLNFDTRTERFTDNAAANKLVSRDYRKPFVIPEKV